MFLSKLTRGYHCTLRKLTFSLLLQLTMEPRSLPLVPFFLYRISGSICLFIVIYHKPLTQEQIITAYHLEHLDFGMLTKIIGKINFPRRRVNLVFNTLNYILLLHFKSLIVEIFYKRRFYLYLFTTLSSTKIQVHTVVLFMMRCRVSQNIFLPRKYSIYYY